MAQIHKELRKKDATSLHTDLTKYIKSTTGYDADLETVKLALMLGPVYRESDENQARRQRDQAAKDKAEQARLNEIAAKRQAIEDRKSSEKQARADRLRAKLAELEADEAPAPRGPRSTVAKSATPAKAPAKKAANKVTPIKRAPKPVAEPTEARGELRETEDDGWGDTAVEDY